MPTTYYAGKRKIQVTGLTRAGTKTTAKKRRVSTVTKAKLQPPTAKNQKHQILANARAISWMSKLVRNNRVWCDWQKFGDCFAQIDPSGAYTTTWGVYPLTDFSSWSGIMRKDANVLESSTTFLTRLQLNLRYSLNASSLAQFTVFITTLRPQSADLDPTVTLPAAGADYIVNSQDYNPRLNSAVFKVHYARNIQMMENSYGMATVAQATAGDPRTTFAKGQITLKPRIKVRAPSGSPSPPWKNLNESQLPYWQRYYLMVYVVQTNAQQALPQSGARLSYDLLATTINSD